MYTALFAMLTLSADALGVIVVSAFHQKYNFNNIRNYSACLATSYLELDSPDRPYENCKDLIRSKEQFKIRWHEVMFYVLVVLFEVGIFAYFSATAQEKVFRLGYAVVFSGILRTGFVYYLYIP